MSVLASSTRSLHLTRWAMAAWSRWRQAATVAERAALGRSCDLVLPEMEALDRLAANVQACGALKSWFHLPEGTATLGLRKGLLDQLLAGVTLDPRGIPDLVRMVQAAVGEVPVGAPAALEAALRKWCQTAPRETSARDLRAGDRREPAMLPAEERTMGVTSAAMETAAAPGWAADDQVFARVATVARQKGYDPADTLTSSRKLILGEVAGVKPADVKRVWDDLRAGRPWPEVPEPESAPAEMPDTGWASGGDGSAHEAEEPAGEAQPRPWPILAGELWTALDEVRSRDARWLSPRLRALHSELGAARRLMAEGQPLDLAAIREQASDTAEELLRRLLGCEPEADTADLPVNQVVAMVARYRRELADLRRETGSAAVRFQTQVLELEAERDVLSAAVRSAQANAQEWREACDKAGAEVERLRGVVKNLQDGLAKMGDERDDARAERDRLLRRVSELEQECGRAEGALETLRRQQAAVPVVEVTPAPAGTALALNGHGHHHPAVRLSETGAQDALRLATGQGVTLETLSLRERVQVLATAADVADLVAGRVAR